MAGIDYSSLPLLFWLNVCVVVWEEKERKTHTFPCACLIKWLKLNMVLYARARRCHGSTLKADLFFGVCFFSSMCNGLSAAPRRLSAMQKDLMDPWGSSTFAANASCPTWSRTWKHNCRAAAKNKRPQPGRQAGRLAGWLWELVC